jgi:predicted nucleotidyltransferase
VTPTLDGDVLAVLAGADAEFTGRQVYRLVGHGSERGVRNALERLSAQGVASSRKAGAANLYKLNREHLAAPWIEGLAGLRSQLLQRLSRAVDEWEVQPVAAVLFGSVADGSASTESDLDLLVVRPAHRSADDPVWEAQIAELERASTAWTGNDARVLEFGEAELADPDSVAPVVEEAARDGIAFFGSLARLGQGRRRGANRPLR